MSRSSLNATLKFATVASVIPFMVACGKKEETWSAPQPAPAAPVATSAAFDNIDGCVRGEIENVLKLSNKSKEDLTGTEYADLQADVQKSCKASYDSALVQHQSSRPRFTDKADCERTFGAGRCETSQPQQTSQGGTTIVQQHDSFSPMFMGFMMGHMLGNMNNNNSGSSFNNGNNGGGTTRNSTVINNYNSAPVQSAPVYKTPSNTYVTPSGKTFDQNTIKQAAPSTFTLPSTPPAPVPKGQNFSTTPYTPPAAVLVKPTPVPAPPSARPVSPADATRPGYVPPVVNNSQGATSSRAVPPAPPAARPTLPPAPPPANVAPARPAFNPAPAPAPRPAFTPAPAPAYRAPAPSPSFGGGRSVGGFGGGGSSSGR
ncbi:MAG: hypothetical protein JWO78_2403 [Micavibrio sp.]|nr:hypothetical protein [Micavibrio sp.]